MDGLALARTLHVLAVVIWIGGVSIVTTALLPAVRRGELGADWLTAFHAIERRFVWQARAAIIIVVAHDRASRSVGQVPLRRLLVDARDGRSVGDLRVGLFVLEPLIPDRHLGASAIRRPAATFAWLAALHWLLLTLSLITIVGAVAGSHGWLIY
jgi:hypothetical protein